MIFGMKKYFYTLKLKTFQKELRIVKTKSLLLMAAAKMNDKADDAVKAISALKYQVGNAAKLIGEESIQLHGGMGVTEEMSIGHYFKRLTTIRTIFGNADYHLKKYSSL